MEKGEKMCFNYIGSKFSLLNFIHYVFDKEVKEKITTVGDLFAGTGIVGLSFKRRGFRIVSNDLQYYSFVINKKFIGINSILEFGGLLNDLEFLKTKKGKERILALLDYLNNNLTLEEGFIYKNYSAGGTKDKIFKRMYFSDENALLIDTIRKKIGYWFENKKITEEEYFYLLGTLLESADKVANTASVYGAFLKSLKNSAKKRLTLSFNPIFKGDKKNEIFNEDITELIEKVNIDVLYLDPPYNQRQYAPNYHILETIARYDSPKIKGKTGLRDYQYQKSKFCIRKDVLNEFKRIVLNTNAKYILLSYNNEGLMSLEEIQKILSLRGQPKTFILKYKRFKSDKTENRNHLTDSTYEYLHFVKCENINHYKEFNPEIIEVTPDQITPVNLSSSY